MMNYKSRVTNSGQHFMHDDRSRVINNDDNNSDNDDDNDNDNSNNGKSRVKERKSKQVEPRWDKFLPLRSLKILLVENDDSTRHLVSALLRNCGYQVTAVDNGKQAWKVLEDLTGDVDLVLSEVVLPRLSGVGLLCKIMRKKSFKNIPVIMMSSHDSSSMVFKCLSKGAVDFLVKPIRKNELKNLWQHVWRKYQVLSDPSGSESGTRVEKSTRSKTLHDSDNDDDIKSIGLELQNDSESGAQSSWTTQASPPDIFVNSYDSTCTQSPTHPIKQLFDNNNNNIHQKAPTSHDDEHDKQIMGKDLRIGMCCSTDNYELENACENGLTSSECTNNDGKGSGVDLNSDQPSDGGVETSIVDMLGASSNGFNSHADGAFKAMLKRPRDIKDTGTNGHDRNGMRHSDASAFSRYNSGLTGNVGSCSPLENSSDAAKTDSMPNNQSDSNGTPPNQSSNGSGNTNDVGSTTNEAFTKQASFSDKPTPNIQSHNGQPNIQGASQSGSSNMLKARADQANGNKKSTSGSSSRGKKSGKSGSVNGSGYELDNDNRFTQREAALKRFRQKRQERCFQKKVRYQSRKNLAEQRPRIRGQFIRKGTQENKGKDINYEPDFQASL